MKEAAASLSPRWYDRADLEACSKGLDARVRVAGGGRRPIEVRVRATDAQAVLGELLNDALARALRRAFGAREAPPGGRGAACEKDRIEALEPDVARQRREETEALLRKARGMGAKP